MAFPLAVRSQIDYLYSMSSHIVSFKDNLIFLSTSLSEDAFGRTQYTREIDETGFIATVPASATDTQEGTGVSFEPWKLSGTQTSPDGMASFWGQLPDCKNGDAQTLLHIFTEGTPEAIAQAATTVCAALSAALAQGVTMEAVGAEGIVLADDKHVSRVLFLPAALFERCANNTRNGYADFQGYYIRKGLTGSESLLFTRAVIAYRALCGALPYTKADLSERQADIFDARFIPSYLQVNGINADVASTIDCGLQVTAEAKPLPGERRFINEKEAEKRKKIHAKAMAFSVAAFKREAEQGNARTNAPTDTALSARREAFVKKQTATVTRRRFLRRNKNRLTVGAIVAVLAIWATTSFYKENLNLATSKGLTSWETTQALYATIHKSSLPHLQEIAKGKKIKTLKQIVSGFYVTNRSRFAMNQEEGTVSTAEWLFFKNKTKFWQYGLTQLRIDGKTADVFYPYPTRADKPAPLKAEDGVTLKRGATVQHKAEYYLVNNDGDARISVHQVTDTVTLTWKGGRWLVTDISSKSKQRFAFTKDFCAAYQAALDATGEDVAASVTILRHTYDWLPTGAELASGEKALRNLTK